MPRYQAKNLYRALVAEAASRGRTVQNDGSGRTIAERIGLAELPTYRNVREGCGIDSDGRPLEECWGAEKNWQQVREGKYNPEDQYGIPVKQRAQLSLADFSIRDLFEQTVVSRSTGEPVGREFVEHYFHPSYGSELRESGMDAVDYSLFYGITGQLLISQVLKSFIQEDFVITNLCGRYPTRILNGERIPGVTLLADPDKDGIEDITAAKAGTPLKYIGLGEEYIELPDTLERRLGIGLTKEVLYGDRTGLVLENASKVGWVLGLRKEKRLIGALIGSHKPNVQFKEKRNGNTAITTVDLYQYAGNTASTDATDGATSNAAQFAYAAGALGVAAGPYQAFVNDVPSNPIQGGDWSAFKVADQYFAEVVDPNTGEPIMVGKPFVVLPYTRRWDLLQITQALNIYKLTQQGGTPGAAFGLGQTLQQTPTSAISQLLAQTFVSSRQLRAQLISQLGLTASDERADDVWFNGDFSEAIRYSENWPLTVVQAPPQSEAEFSQDIPVRFKVFERGNAAIWNPRVVQRHNYRQESSGQ
jgi:hypothetical protein